MFRSCSRMSFATWSMAHKSPLWKQQRPIFVSSISLDDRRDHPSSSQDSKNKSIQKKNQDDLTVAVTRKHKIFQDVDSPVILDIDEECQQSTGTISVHTTLKLEDEFSGLNLQRGVHGVFDIEELIEVLKKDKAVDIFVASLPPELKYVDFIVVVSGKSPRHMLAMAEFVRKAFKRKMHPSDIIPRIEGENSKDWIALDLGNIALHVFSKAARRVYDLDSLWGIGSKYDDLCNKPEDPLIALLRRHSVYLGDLAPNETNG